MHQHPSFQLELARQRQAEFLVEAKSARLAASVATGSSKDEPRRGAFGQALRELAARVSARTAASRPRLTTAS